MEERKGEKQKEGKRKRKKLKKEGTLRFCRQQN